MCTRAVWAQVGPDREVNVPAGATRIDAAGKYLMPGLAEMHGHIPQVQGSGASPGQYAEDMLYLYLTGGVTTVRGMLGSPGQLDLKAAVDSGVVTGPHLSWRDLPSTATP
ncbi:MAG: hypothetical protein U5K31_06895 [Balneolaceae bacterium]|nr:hypothetical protein [Balneolaceae bacterium]